MGYTRFLLFLLLASTLLLKESLSKPGRKKHKAYNCKRLQHNGCKYFKTKKCPVEYTADQIRNRLALLPQSGNQGGYLVETYRSTENVDTERGNRTAGTHIYYMIDRRSPADLYHLLLSDEVWHFYIGDPVKLVELDDSVPGDLVETVLGNDIFSGHNITHVVKRNTWFSAYRIEGGPCGWSLVGTTVSPGFEFEDFRAANRTELLALFPEARLSIINLTLSDE